MYYNFYAPYVSVAEKLAKVKKFVAKKLGNKAQPISLESKKITSTFWGNAWCKQLENHAAMLNRLDRGKTYVRNGSVAHLEIQHGRILAYVAGSQPYTVNIDIKPLQVSRWRSIKKQCAGEISSAVELLLGKLSDKVMSVVTEDKTGLFPEPKEMEFDCSCPDGAGGWMCKHVAAVLYAIGARLDKEPELLFKLRCVDHLELIDTKITISSGKKDSETLDESALGAIFGVELADSLDEKPKRRKSAKKAVKKTAAKKVTKKTVKKSVKKRAKKTAKKWKSGVRTKRTS